MRLGGFLKCAAVHVATGTEVTAVGPVAEPKAIERIAMAKLRRALAGSPD